MLIKLNKRIMSTKSELEYFVKTMMKGDDYRVQLVSERYGACFICMIQTLNIKKETITSGLEIMSEEILAGEVKLSHVLVLIAFCIELDKNCKLKQYPWYSPGMLTEIIVNILWRIEFVPPSSLYYFKICNII